MHENISGEKCFPTGYGAALLMGKAWSLGAGRQTVQQETVCCGGLGGEKQTGMSTGQGAAGPCAEVLLLVVAGGGGAVWEQ